MQKKLIVFFFSFMGLLFLATTNSHAFSIKSPDISPEADLNPKHLFNGFGCTGKNISPALIWEKAPQNAKSFAITLYDPDAPTGSGWWHWVVFNIPANVTSLPQGVGSGQEQLPAGAIQGKTDFNMAGYGGPCPPEGDKPHRYILTIYALDTENIPLDENAPPAMVGFNIFAHIIDSASMTFEYGR